MTHDAAASPEPVEYQLEEGWEVVDGPRRRPFADGSAWVWTVLALEPGERELPAPDLQLDDGSLLAVAPAALGIAAELGPEEDAPRPYPELRSIAERTSPVRPRHLGWGLLAAIALLVAWLLLRRQLRRRGAEREPTELERFRGIDRGGLAEGAQARLVAFELSELLRSAAERALDLELVAHTDEEWSAALRADGRLPADLVDDLEGLLAHCTEVKFARVQPTRFALEELLTSTEKTLGRLAAPLVPAEVSA